MSDSKPCHTAVPCTVGNREGGPDPQRYLGAYFSLKSMGVRLLFTLEDLGLCPELGCVFMEEIRRSSRL